MIENGSRPRIYFDTTIFISAFEAGDEISNRLRRVFERVRPRQIVTSEITLAELLGKESAIHGWVQQKRLYLNLLVFRQLIDLRQVTRGILIETAEYRRAVDKVGYKVKLADAVHLVTAIEAGCRYLFTADKRFPVPSPLNRLTFDEGSLASLERVLDA